MSAAPKNLPRFLPTLTEVVQAPALVQPPAAAPPSADQEEIIRRVLQRLDASLELRLRQELESIVREAVAMELNPRRSD